SLDLASQGWRGVRSTIGVTDIVRFGDQPTPLPHGVIEALRSQEDSDGLMKLRTNPIKPGAPVRILDGPFAHLRGLCESMRDSERVAILLDMLGRKVRLVLEAEAVEAA